MVVNNRLISKRNIFYILPIVVGGIILSFFMQADEGLGSKIFGGVLLGWSILIFINLTISHSNSGAWRVFRALGIILSFYSVIGIWIGVEDHHLTNIFDFNTNNANLVGAQKSMMLLLFSMLLYGIGEVLLYLSKLSNGLKIVGKEMLCPRCVSKGYVDKNDIERLQMEDKWEPGNCAYCDGQGYVPRGSAKDRDPIYGYDAQVKDFDPDIKEAFEISSRAEPKDFLRNVVGKLRSKD